MKEKHLKYLACPKCDGELEIKEVSSHKGETIESGLLYCLDCEVCFKKC